MLRVIRPKSATWSSSHADARGWSMYVSLWSGIMAALSIPLIAAAADKEFATPSNPGGPGPAAFIKGDAEAGARLFRACVACHGPEGRGGVANPGSDEGSIPALNPLDASLIDRDPSVFAERLDPFLQRGSSMSGPHPLLAMPAWGDRQALTQRQIADLEAYVMRLNGVAR